LSPSFLRTTAAKKPRTVCGCQPVERMTVVMVAPLGPLSNASTRACFEFVRAWRWPEIRPQAAFAQTLEEDCAFAIRARLPLDMPKLLSIASAQDRAATT
jgi:hypothetical protein